MRPVFTARHQASGTSTGAPWLRSAHVKSADSGSGPRQWTLQRDQEPAAYRFSKPLDTPGHTPVLPKVLRRLRMAGRVREALIADLPRWTIQTSLR